MRESCFTFCKRKVYASQKKTKDEAEKGQGTHDVFEEKSEVLFVGQDFLRHDLYDAKTT